MSLKFRNPDPVDIAASVEETMAIFDQVTAQMESESRMGLRSLDTVGFYTLAATLTLAAQNLHAAKLLYDGLHEIRGDRS